MVVWDEPPSIQNPEGTGKRKMAPRREGKSPLEAGAISKLERFAPSGLTSGTGLGRAGSIARYSILRALRALMLFITRDMHDCQHRVACSLR